MSRLSTLVLLAVFATLVPLAASYCNLKTYRAYLKKQEVACGSSKSTYCDKTCKKAIVAWVMYSDGCVAPNENSLPHPFLDDNGINPVYQKDMHEMKVRYKHYCGVPWSSATRSSASSMLLAVGAALFSLAAIRF